MSTAVHSLIGSRSSIIGVERSTLVGKNSMGKSAGEREQEASDRMGKVRCLNCFHRCKVLPKADRFVCPECGWEWRVSWVNPQFAKVRGPMWDKMEP
jgi:protein-arginine kinase activator protein McsA